MASLKAVDHTDTEIDRLNERVETLEAHDARDRLHMEDVLKRLDYLDGYVQTLQQRIRLLEV